METVTLFDAVRACSIVLLGGVVLHAGDVTAGNGSVIDWRTVKSGEELCPGGDAFDTAYLFVSLVGPEAAIAAALRDQDIDPPAPEPCPSPRAITEVEAAADGARFEDLALACPDRVQPPLERRPGNALCIEIGQPLPRCRRRIPESWDGHDAGATRWLLSGGSPFVLGLCCPAACPRAKEFK